MKRWGGKILFLSELNDPGDERCGTVYPFKKKFILVDSLGNRRDF